MTKTTNQYNTVAADLIWIDHVAKEWMYTKKWPKNWGFLSASLPDIGQERADVKSIPTKRHHKRTNKTTTHCTSLVPNSPSFVTRSAKEQEVATVPSDFERVHRLEEFSSRK